ncbi:MAG: aldehyde dehydrogenase family protein, partial [Persicimonas sp.]
MNKPTSVKDLLFGDLWDYAPAPQGTDFVELKERYGHFIGGEFVEPEECEYFETINPATEEPLAEIARADEAVVDRAVEAARTAYENVWRDLAPSERAKYIFRIGRMVKEKSRELAVVESMDGGKPIRESRDHDIPLVA